MSRIKTLRIQHLRSHTKYEAALAEGVTVITGPNGSGKTTLIEALYIALQGSSFRGADKDVLQQDAPWWRIMLTFEETDDRITTFDSARPTKRKQFTIDGKSSGRLAPKDKFPVILFEPEDLRLLNGSPARRRTFIDRLITQLNPFYGTTLRKYERALKQRNSLLKRLRFTEDELFAWNVSLAEHGAYIIEQRIVYVEQLNRDLTDAYYDIAQKKDDIAVHYSYTVVGDIRQRLLRDLTDSQERDAHLGNTSVGPHRHDLLFSFNGQPATTVASRGEIRTIVLALKFLEVAITETLTGQKPLILLDDVFSELDTKRQQALSTRTKEYQIVMTSTHVVSNDASFTHIELG